MNKSPPKSPLQLGDFNRLPCGLLVTDSGGLVLQSNEYLDELLGYQSGDITGQHLNRLMPTPSQLFAEIYLWPTLIKEGTISEIHLNMSHKGGKRLPMLINIERATSDEQEFYIWAIFPANERNKLEEELIKARYAAENDAKKLSAFSKELEISNETLTDFTYMVSHDIRSPLISLRKILEILNSNPEEEMKTRLTGLVFRQIDKLEELVKGLLDYARGSQGHDDVETIDLPSVMRDIFELLPSPTTFQFEYDSQIEEIEALSVPLQFVLRNLISNAIKYHNREDGLIKVTCVQDDNHYIFSVIDDGPGIAPENHDNIFRAFKRLVSNNQIVGSGLGLATVQKTIKGYGGDISVHSELGEGAHFKFTWPKNKL